MTTKVMQKRLAVTGALVALALPALTACSSFDYATDRPNEIAHGGSTLDGAVRINAARIVTSQEGSGILVGTFSLDPAKNPAVTGAAMPSVTSIATSADSAKTVTPESFKPIELPTSGIVNLADPANGGIAVTGDFKPGDSIPMTFTFSEGEEKTISVPVVTQCGPYAEVVAAADEAETATKPGKKGKNAESTESEGAATGSEAGSEGAGSEGTEGEEEASTLPADAPAEGETAAESDEAHGESAGTISEDPYSCEFPPAALPGAEEEH
ncbi:hypothetical protein J2S40_003294 [Nocardioides luteus]|uniref:Lipoprotein n=1 Tax=Nocardioides luteus TaxID=1844 RepID=A0ABQ5SWG8_9ACTN|nr:hypothetical protein [Nocardioides luteus]MDR7312236.1 hypothetical protein [Nocardioides luteus]GLJ68482.1 hypothetical protein GCM10017579_25180 [Nocardioides luteus]